jgi:phosphohistidine phosphatase SixA
MPPNLEGCVTQRNLDAMGRRQSVALGEMIRAHNVVVDKVLTSAWCRTRETALLMKLGPVPEETPMWRRLGVRTANVEEAAAEIRELVSQWKGPGTLVIVNHGSSMRAVFDIGHPPQAAEIIVLRPQPGGWLLIGTIDPPK